MALVEIVLNTGDNCFCHVSRQAKEFYRFTKEMGCPSQHDAYLRVLYGDYDKPDYTYLATASATTRQQVDNQSRLPVR